MIIDWDKSLKLAMCKQELAQELIDKLLASLPDTRKIIEHAFESKDFEKLSDEVHRLHGACCYIGVPELKNAARGLDQALVKKVAEDDIADLFGKLQKAIGNLLEYYRVTDYKGDD